MTNGAKTSAARSTNGGAAPTLEQVAAHAGVSRATASRAINGGARVSPKALEAVNAAVKDLGYVPNRAARSLVTRRTDSIALVVPEPDDRLFSDPFFAHTIKGVSRALDEADQQLILLLAHHGASSERALRYLRNGYVDGAFIVSHHRGDDLVSRLVDIGLPTVFGGRPFSAHSQVSYVDGDNFEGGRIEAQLLIDRGCKRIATVAGPQDMTAAVDRLNGWREVLTAANLPTDAISYGDFTVAGGRRAGKELLAAHPDVDGIAVASDLMATGVLEVLAAAGKRVPDDVAVVGFDDLGVAAGANPPLTTVRNPVEDIAERGINLLLEHIESGATGGRQQIILPVEAIQRASA